MNLDKILKILLLISDFQMLQIHSTLNMQLWMNVKAKTNENVSHIAKCH